MAADVIRIFSDLHYGDRASQIHRLEQLQPLATQIDRLVLNGDTIDTRAGPRPEYTAACRSDVRAFVRETKLPVTLLTGNHDPDISSEHWLELGGGEVLVLHGDVLFDDIVPWGRDARVIRGKINDLLGPISVRQRMQLDLTERTRIWRMVAGSIAQRHQSERNPLKYAAHFLADTVWPPTRFVEILRAWRSEPDRAAALVQAHRPKARFVIVGHTHRPAIRRVENGPVVINTGSFTTPFGGYVVDVNGRWLRVRRIRSQRREFHPGPVVAEFPLANG